MHSLENQTNYSKINKKKTIIVYKEVIRDNKHGNETKIKQKRTVAYMHLVVIRDNKKGNWLILSLNNNDEYK